MKLSTRDLDRELMAFKLAAKDLKKGVSTHRIEKVALGHRWSCSPHGKSWLQRYDILMELLDAILNADFCHNHKPRNVLKTLTFSIPKDLGSYFLAYTIRRIIRLLRSFIAKIQPGVIDTEGIDDRPSGWDASGSELLMLTKAINASEQWLLELNKPKLTFKDVDNVLLQLASNDNTAD